VRKFQKIKCNISKAGKKHISGGFMQTMKDLLPFLKWKNLGKNPLSRLSQLYFWKIEVQGSVHNPEV